MKATSARRKSTPGQRPTRTQRGAISFSAYLTLCLLLVIPCFALRQLSWLINWRFLAAVPVAASAITFLAYRKDKLRAEAGEWRIPESTLHLGELAGGWPAAFLAQRKFRHKISKNSYQLKFWAVVLLHQFIALDFLFGWRYSKIVLHSFR